MSGSMNSELCHAPFSSAVLIGKADLQDKVLAHLVEMKLGIEVMNVRLESNYHASLWHEEKMMIINCNGMECDSVVKALRTCNLEPGGLNSILVNVNPKCLDGLKEVWHIVSGIFYENIDPETFLNGVRYVLNGGLWLPRRVMEALLRTCRRGGYGLSTERTTPLPELTKRELQILQRIADGCSNEAIAEKLFLSKHTIKSHLYNIYKKIGARNRMEAANWLNRYYSETA